MSSRRRAALRRRRARGGAAIDARGGAALRADNPDLAAAITHEVYETYGDVTPNEKELTVAAARVYDQVEPILYREKVSKSLEAADIQATDDEIKRIQQRLKQRKVRADSPRFRGEVIAARAELKAEGGTTTCSTSFPTGRASPSGTSSAPRSRPIAAPTRSGCSRSWASLPTRPTTTGRGSRSR